MPNDTYPNEKQTGTKLDAARDEIKRLKKEKEDYLDCLKMILNRECCAELCDSSDCDCVWERVCQTIDPERWKEIQAPKGE